LSAEPITDQRRLKPSNPQTPKVFFVLSHHIAGRQSKLIQPQVDTLDFHQLTTMTLSEFQSLNPSLLFAPLPFTK
jgi:hypothetical protein